jgi:hypothetical protein
MSWYILPKSIISYLKSFFSIVDNIKIQLINKIWYSTKYTIIDLIMYEKNKYEMIQYITNKTIFHNIENIDLSNIKNITNDIVNLICAIPKLRNFNLSGTNVSDDNLKLLLKGKNIYDLNISYCNNLTDDFMSYITSFPNLEILNLSYSCKITEKGISYLEKTNNLKNLNLSKFCDANNSLVHISKIINLEKLDINGNRLHIDNIKYLTNNKKLNTLYIAQNNEEYIKQIPYFDTVDIIYKSYFLCHHICHRIENTLDNEI